MSFAEQYKVANLLGNISNAVDELHAKAAAGSDYMLEPRNPDSPMTEQEIRAGIEFAVRFGAINPAGLDEETVSNAIDFIISRRLRRKNAA